MKSVPSLSIGWMVLNAAALAASLSHVLLDYAIGLYGKLSEIISPLQAMTILLICLLYAYWMLVMGWTNGARKSALISLLLLTVMWSFLANGVAGMVACPPLCRSAFPYMDIAHISSLIFGGLAAYTTWRRIKTTSGPIDWWLPGYTIILLLATFVFQSVVTLPNLYLPHTRRSSGVWQSMCMVQCVEMDVFNL